MSGGRGGEWRGQRAAAPSCPCLCYPRLPPLKEILMVIKCPLVTIHMSNWDLWNVIVARQHRYVWIFVFLNIKFAGSIKRPKAKCFNFKGLRPSDPLTRGSVPKPRYVFLLHTITEYNGRPLTHTKMYCPCALALAPLVASQVQISSAANGADAADCHNHPIL